MFPFVPVFLYSLNLFFKFLFFPFIDWHLITQNSDSPENTSALIKKWLGQDDKYLFHIPIPCSKSCFLLAQHQLFQKGFFLFYTRIFFIWKIKLPPPPQGTSMLSNYKSSLIGQIQYQNTCINAQIILFYLFHTGEIHFK